MSGNDQYIDKTSLFVKRTLLHAEAGHDWLHTQRVVQNTLSILKYEPKAHPLIVKIGALLHDIADPKFHNNDETLGVHISQEFLKTLGLKDSIVEQILFIVENISFGGGKKVDYPTLELKIVQDADRLDALGAIGIARCFHFGGYKNRPIFDQEILPKLNLTPENYRQHIAPSLNHFFEKLILLKDQMNTAKGKELAEQRHQFLITYLKQFLTEVNAPKSLWELIDVVGT